MTIRKIIPNDSGCSDSWVKKKKLHIYKRKKKEMETVDLQTAYMISLFAHANLSVIARRGNIHTRVYIYIYVCSSVHARSKPAKLEIFKYFCTRLKKNFIRIKRIKCNRFDPILPFFLPLSPY